jgi:hypothetical protein
MGAARNPMSQEGIAMKNLDYASRMRWIPLQYDRARAMGLECIAYEYTWRYPELTEYLRHIERGEAIST